MQSLRGFVAGIDAEQAAGVSQRIAQQRAGLFGECMDGARRAQRLGGVVRRKRCRGGQLRHERCVQRFNRAEGTLERAEVAVNFRGDGRCVFRTEVPNGTRDHVHSGASGQR